MLQKENSLSDQDQTWQAYSPWQLLGGMHWPWDQEIKGQGHTIIKSAAGVGMHVDMTV